MQIVVYWYNNHNYMRDTCIGALFIQFLSAHFMEACEFNVRRLLMLPM